MAEAINLGAIMITAYSAPALLRQVRSLNELVGTETRLPRIHPTGRPLPGVQVVVIGDSTAAGAGLAPFPGASGTARDCGRSADSYAADLSVANGWKVLNLACDGATISRGLLGPQRHHGHRLPPQLSVVERARGASVIIVSVGADDLDWAATVRYCAVTAHCDDRATTAYFQQQLASFSKNYLDLLSRLAALPSHPQVIINRYYDPFGTRARLPRPGRAQRREPADPDIPAGNAERGTGRGRGPVQVLRAAARLRRAPAVHAAAVCAGTGRSGPVSPDCARPARHRPRRPGGRAPACRLARCPVTVAGSDHAAFGRGQRGGLPAAEGGTERRCADVPHVVGDVDRDCRGDDLVDAVEQSLAGRSRRRRGSCPGVPSCAGR